ncbi:hypothetical protein H9P43_010041 [Blastocladiella emersonii ATCC 22665]|nr:hypothetical protein H9P43_010041 [Blastocladiella emersonii ATCC 22665]
MVATSSSRRGSASWESPLPTPTTPSLPTPLHRPAVQLMYTHHHTQGTLTCHACQKTMPLARRPRGQPCLQYTIKYHEATDQHAICAVGYYLWSTTSRSTAHPYTPPPNLARYSGTLSVTALECLLFNPLYSVQRSGTGGAVVCHACNVAIPYVSSGTSAKGAGGGLMSPNGPRSGSGPLSASLDAVAATVAHENTSAHELGVLRASMQVTRAWGRRIRICAAPADGGPGHTCGEGAPPELNVGELVLTDQEREWQAERRANASAAAAAAATPAPVTTASAASTTSVHIQPPAVHAPACPAAPRKRCKSGTSMMPAAYPAGRAAQVSHAMAVEPSVPESRNVPALVSPPGSRPRLLGLEDARPFPPPVAYAAPAAEGAWEYQAPPAVLQPSPPQQHDPPQQRYPQENYYQLPPLPQYQRHVPSHVGYAASNSGLDALAAAAVAVATPEARPEPRRIRIQDLLN